MKRTNLGNRASPSKVTSCVLEFLFDLSNGKKCLGQIHKTDVYSFRSGLCSQNPSTKSKFNLNLKNLLFYLQDGITIILNPSNLLNFQVGNHQNYNLKSQNNFPEITTLLHFKWKVNSEYSIPSFLRNSLQL